MLDVIINLTYFVMFRTVPLKFIFSFFTLFVFSLITLQNISAQKADMSRAEYKDWKKRKKDMNVLEFKEVVEDYGKFKSEVNKLKRQIASKQEEIDDLKKALASERSTTKNLRQQLDECQQSSQQNAETLSDEPCESEENKFDKGVVYRVQIGSFRNKDLSKFQSSGNFWVQDGDGEKKYTIGNFRDYEEATMFKKYMREMGVKDAWVVTYDNNTRINIKDVK